MIDFSKLIDASIPTEAGEKQLLKIESGGTVIWKHRSISPISLEVEKRTTSWGETKIFLAVYGTSGGSAQVTYGGLTKVINFSSSDAHLVFFGSYSGNVDEVETPESGTLTIEGDVKAVGISNQYSGACYCITGINNWGPVEYLPMYAFVGCKSLDVSYIPEGITQIQLCAFLACDAITRIRIPSTVTEIGASAFKRCSNLATVIMDATTPPSIGNSYDSLPFAECPNLTEIIVPAGCGDAYRTASYWSSYAGKIAEAV